MKFKRSYRSSAGATLVEYTVLIGSGLLLALMGIRALGVSTKEALLEPSAKTCITYENPEGAQSEICDSNLLDEGYSEKPLPN